MPTNYDKQYCHWCGEELQRVYEERYPGCGEWRIKHHKWENCVKYLKAKIDLLENAHAEPEVIRYDNT